MSLEEGIVCQCIVSDDDGGGRSLKGWVGLEDGGIKKRETERVPWNSIEKSLKKKL